MANLLDPVFEGSLAGATRFVVVGRPVKLKRLTSPADRDLPLAAHLVDELALPARLHSFSADHVLRHFLVERQIGNQLLQLGVLILELLPPPHLGRQRRESFKR